MRDATRLARYGGLAELKKQPAHIIGQLFFYALGAGAEPAGVPPVLIDISAPEVVVAWTKAMEAHASQMQTRNYVELQLARARVHGLNSGIGHAQPLWPNDPLVFTSLASLSRSANRFLNLRFLVYSVCSVVNPKSLMSSRPLRIGITCHPSVGGSGILASELGEELAGRGHEVHFISHAEPFRLPRDQPRIHFHPVKVNDYDLFKYPDYTLPLSVKMAEVSGAHQLDVLHVHYAVPHATAAMLAMSMLPVFKRPRVIVTLHGTDVMLLGCDAGYGPAIRHALDAADGVTTVSQFLKSQVRIHLDYMGNVEVIPNFFAPQKPTRIREAVRAELGLAPGEAMLLHTSNLRPVKRIDLLLQTVAQIRPRESFKLVMLAGGDSSRSRR